MWIIGLFQYKFIQSRMDIESLHFDDRWHTAIQGEQNIHPLIPSFSEKYLFKLLTDSWIFGGI